MSFSPCLYLDSRSPLRVTVQKSSVGIIRCHPSCSELPEQEIWTKVDGCLMEIWNYKKEEGRVEIVDIIEIVFNGGFSWICFRSKYC